MTELTPKQMLDAIKRALEKSAQRVAREELARALIEAEESGLSDRTVGEVMGQARARISGSSGMSGK